MKTYCCMKWAAIHAILQIMLSHIISAVELDIKGTFILPDIDVYEGTYENGGVYRMYHSKTFAIHSVSYGKILWIFDRLDVRLQDVYVQEYKRGVHTFVAISCFYALHEISLNSYYFSITTDGEKDMISRSVRKFHDGPISLILDLNSVAAHPYITKRDKGFGEGVFGVWSIIPCNPYEHRKTNAGRLRQSNGVFLLSPIINIDDSNNPDDPPSSLISHAIKIKRQRKGWYTLWIRIRPQGVQHSLWVPEVANGIFIPHNILQSHSFVLRPLTKFNRSIVGTILVDISSLENANILIVILANIRRGNWIYTQYSIVPLSTSVYTPVEVIDSRLNSMIFVSSPENIVTHVELFRHDITHAQYLLVHMRRIVDGIPPRKQQPDQHVKIYKRIDKGQTTIYFDMSEYWLDYYVDAFKNVVIYPAVENQGAREIIMCTI